LPITVGDRRRLRSLVRLLHDADKERLEPAVSLSILGLIAEAVARAGYEWNAQNNDLLIDRVLQRLYTAAPHRQLDNLTLAQEAGVSVNTLLRRFQRATKTSPRQFLLQLRVERGAELLRGGQRTIPEIAELCGFVDRYHFTRAFTARVGTSPAVFSERYRGTHSLERGSSGLMYQHPYVCAIHV
jgi:AraC-like DNA-binding protein